MHKIVNELIVHMHDGWRYLKNKKSEEPTKSTDGVSDKNPSNVKSVIEESPITLKLWEPGNFAYLWEEEAWCLYNGVELSKIPWT